MPREVDAAAATTVEQLLAENRLKALHLHRHRRLRAADKLRRSRETALLRDDDEGAQQIRIERCRSGHAIKLIDGVHECNSFF